MRADLPLLNSTSSANVLVVLAIGIALAVLGALLLAIAVVIIVRQRRQLRSLRRYRQDWLDRKSSSDATALHLLVTVLLVADTFEA